MAQRRAVVLLCVLAAVPASARADENNVAQARAAYDAGAAAYDARDWGPAAVQLARADGLAPNETVLKLALTACTRADDAVLCMNLVERARTRGVLAEQRDDVSGRFASRTTRVRLECAPGDPCTGRLDGAPLAPNAPAWTAPGTHRLEIDSRSGHEQRLVTFIAGSDVRLTAEPVRALATERAPLVPLTPATSTTSVPAPAAATSPTPAEAPRGGISPAWFWVGAGVTVALGTATIVSGVDTLDRHAAFAADPTNARAQDGFSAQRRTNILLGGTIAAAAITSLVGLALVRWSDPKSAQAARR